MTVISKLDAARQNLRAAIRLFFERGDPVAIHTLAAAAQSVIRDIARARGLEHTSILHDHPEIPRNLRRQWINKLNAPRNFFKHADDDPDGTLDFDEGDNALVLLDAVLILSELSEKPLTEANVFVGWFTIENPVLRPAMSNNVIGDYCVRNCIPAGDFDRFRKLCDEEILFEPIRTPSKVK